MGVFTLHTSNIKGFVFQFACASHPGIFNRVPGQSHSQNNSRIFSVFSRISRVSLKIILGFSGCVETLIEFQTLHDTCIGSQPRTRCVSDRRMEQVPVQHKATSNHVKVGRGVCLVSLTSSRVLPPARHSCLWQVIEWPNQGPGIEHSRRPHPQRTRRHIASKWIQPAVVNGSVHTARKLHQSIFGSTNLRAHVQCGLGLCLRQGEGECGGE